MKNYNNLPFIKFPKVLLLWMLITFSSDLSNADEMQIELRDGSLLRGEILFKSPDSIKIKTVLGEQTIRGDQLSEKTRSELKFSSTEDLSSLRIRIAELEQKVQVLETENQQLRRQLVTQTTSKQLPSVYQTPAAQVTPTTSSAEKSWGYWISSTGKRHNSSCRYFKNCKGHEGDASEGVACKICGG